MDVVGLLVEAEASLSEWPGAGLTGRLLPRSNEAFELRRGATESEPDTDAETDPSELSVDVLRTRVELELLGRDHRSNSRARSV